MRKCAILAGFLFCLGCQSVYYNTMEAMGHPKRKLLVSRVQDARDSQTEAKEQFTSALEQFSSVVNFKGGRLEEKYTQLKDQYDLCKDKTDKVNKRVISVKDVAEALFKEWEYELEEYTSEQLRRVSEVKLERTKENYDKMIEKMDRARLSINPVLSSLYDQVLFLKHNLNAQAVVSLKDELQWVERNTDSLVKEMEASIEEANRFIGSMQIE